jgi:hypothetical protein
MRIAHVGFTGSISDETIYIDSYNYIKIEDNDIYEDFLDLSKGRDFLKENKKYDIVILYFIFKYRNDELSESEKSTLGLFPPNEFLVSDLHFPETWRQRLLETEASMILIHCGEYDSEVNGEYIGELPDYNREKITNKGFIWRYTKL